MLSIIVDSLLLVYLAFVRFVMFLVSFFRFTSSRSSTVQINTLSEECLLLIFDRIPLAELMRLDQVCTRWAMLLPSATARRRTLALIASGYRLDEMCFVIPFNDDFEMSYDSYRPYYKFPERESALTLPFLVSKSFDEYLLSSQKELKGFFDILFDTSIGGQTEAEFTELARLKHARLTGQLATYFAHLFPNLTNLLVIHPECFESELQSVSDLLISWPLVNVKLWLHTEGIDKKYENLPDKHPIGILLHNINSQQTSLRQLSLNIEGFGKVDEVMKFTFPVESYSFIGKLKVAKLSLGFYDNDNTIWQTVHRLDSPNLENIGLGNRADLHLNSALSAEFSYTHKVRQLYSIRTFETVQELGELCSRFNSLTMLEMYWHPNLTFTELVANLASLHQLTYLIFYIRFRRHPRNLFALMDRAVADGDQRRQPNSLPQVKILRMVIKKRTHRDFESFSSRVFPSLEAIIVNSIPSTPQVTQCIICRPNINLPYSLRMAKRCDRLLISSLRSKFARNSSILFYPAPVTLDKALLMYYAFITVLAFVLFITAGVMLFSMYKLTALAIFYINLFVCYLLLPFIYDIYNILT